MSKMTISLEVEDVDSPILKQLMESFVENKSILGVKVYAASHDCLFEQIEAIEEILDDTWCTDKDYHIERVIR
jgi:hypothetical protein